MIYNVRNYQTVLEIAQYIFHCYICVGGVIEDNEVFGNKFDGICLATGVNPRLKGGY